MEINAIFESRPVDPDKLYACVMGEVCIKKTPDQFPNANFLFPSNV